MKKIFAIVFILELIFINKVSLPQNITYEFGWIKYYEARNNKIVGIWPHWNRWNNVEKLKELRTRWGFNYVLSYPLTSPPVYSNVLAAGYLPSQIMVYFKPEAGYNYPDLLQFPQSYGYYVDEPSERGFSLAWLTDAKNYIVTNFPGSQLFISGFKRTSNLNNMVSISDHVMFSSYKHWWLLLGFWVSCCPENPDQRSDWSDMKNRYGVKFSTTWIGAHMDMSDYDDLIGHAQNLGLNSIWLYQHQPFDNEVGDSNLEAFCSNAASKNFLNAFFQQVRDELHDGILVKRQFVGNPYQNNIPSNYDHTNVTLTNIIVTNDRVDDYYAYYKITAGDSGFFIVPENKSASLNSYNNIVLKPGFHAKTGSSFCAYLNQ
jgi:hypothetical protein